MVHAWALCGASLVYSKENVDATRGQPEKLRRCHMSVSMRYLGFAYRKAQQFKGSPKERVDWIIDRDRATRDAARTLFTEGYTLGVNPSSAHSSKSAMLTGGSLASSP